VTTEAGDQVRGIGGLSSRAATWLAWSLCAACVALIVLALLLQLLTGFVPYPAGRPGLGFAVLAGVLSLAYPTVGALIASRLPTNPIGWIFCSLGLLFAAQRVIISYADYALNENFAMPGGEYVAWASTWTWFATPTLAIFLMLLFPQGRLPSRRWRIVAWVALCGGALTALGDMFMPGDLPSHPYVENPFGEVEVIGGGFATYDLFGASSVFGMTLLATSTLAALVSVLVRLRRARGDERQQLRWFLYAAVPLTVCGSLIIVHFVISTFTTTFLFHPVYLLSTWAAFNAVDYVTLFALLVVPVFTYIAILKYHLYDVDIVINRALVYGSLTVLLAAVYFGGVTVTQTIFRALTGQEEQPQLTIVVSTLVIAALFTPLRRRIQSFIDSRFYRRKYDARKTLEAFSSKLRDETDLDALSNDLVGVVRETMQPTHVSLWLRPDSAPKGEQIDDYQASLW
jgi:hypothetical protein